MTITILACAATHSRTGTALPPSDNGPANQPSANSPSPSPTPVTGAETGAEESPVSTTAGEELDLGSPTEEDRRIALSQGQDPRLEMVERLLRDARTPREVARLERYLASLHPPGSEQRRRWMTAASWASLPTATLRRAKEWFGRIGEATGDFPPTLGTPGANGPQNSANNRFNGRRGGVNPIGGNGPGNNGDDPVFNQFNALPNSAHQASLGAPRARVVTVDDAPTHMPFPLVATAPLTPAKDRADNGGLSRDEGLAALKAMSDKVGAHHKLDPDPKHDLERTLSKLNQGAKSPAEKISLDELRALPVEARQMVESILDSPEPAGTFADAETGPRPREGRAQVESRQGDARQPSPAGAVPRLRPVEAYGAANIDGTSADGKFAVLSAPPSVIASSALLEKELPLSGAYAAKDSEKRVRLASGSDGDPATDIKDKDKTVVVPAVPESAAAVAGGGILAMLGTGAQGGSDILSRVVSALRRRFVGAGGQLDRGEASSGKVLPGTMETAMEMARKPALRKGILVSADQSARAAMTPVSETIPPLAILAIGWITIAVLLCRRFHAMTRLMAWARRGKLAAQASVAAPKSYRKPATAEDTAVTQVYASRQITDTITASIGN